MATDSENQSLDTDGIEEVGKDLKLARAESVASESKVEASSKRYLIVRVDSEVGWSGSRVLPEALEGLIYKKKKKTPSHTWLIVIKPTAVDLLEASNSVLIPASVQKQETDSLTEKLEEKLFYATKKGIIITLYYSGCRITTCRYSSLSS